MKSITSRDNPAVKQLVRLSTSSRHRRAARRLVLDGVHVIQAYRDAFGLDGCQLVFRAESLGAPEIGAWAEVSTGMTTLVLPGSLFALCTPVETPTGILAVAPWPELTWPAASGSGFLVLVDGVQDPGNLGAILRSAAAAGSIGALLSVECADPWSPRSLRGGMGAQFVLPVREGCDLPAEAERLGGPVFAADAGGGVGLFDLELPERCGFVVGAEGRGVDAKLLARSDAHVRIPMAAGVESLNVAAAATLLFYEWMRRGLRAGSPGSVSPGQARGSTAAGR
jgi:TrmH family RNA methyltransferase